MTAPANKTMFNYFTKLPSKASVVEESNPRKLAPVYNKQHVREFQTSRLHRFDAELFNINNIYDKNGAEDTDASRNNGHTIIGDDMQSADDHPMDISTSCTNYIEDIKSGEHIPFRLRKRRRGPLRARLLQYHEDVRPPYFGTWQRKSKKITGRRPFAMDDDIFDYEVDSEAEWDIGGPGESLKGDDSDDDEELDDYEIDMQTFVPHGYVSDDEVDANSDREEANQSVEEICDDSNASVQIVNEVGVKPSIKAENVQPQVQHQPAVQTLPQQQPKQAKLEIKPIILGIYYENDERSSLSESKIQFLKSFQGVSCK